MLILPWVVTVIVTSSSRGSGRDINDISSQNSTFDYSDARGLATRDKPSLGGHSTKRIKKALKQQKRKEIKSTRE